jgi:hypothetical protein
MMIVASAILRLESGPPSQENMRRRLLALAVITLSVAPVGNHASRERLSGNLG